MSDKRAKLTRGLRELADFLDANPDVPVRGLDCCINVFADDKAHIVRTARIAGWQKNYNGNWFALQRWFGDGAIQLDVNIERGEICRRVVTGTEVIPAQPERTVDTVEWVCDTPLLAGEAVPA